MKWFLKSQNDQTKCQSKCPTVLEGPTDKIFQPYTIVRQHAQIIETILGKLKNTN